MTVDGNNDSTTYQFDAINRLTKTIDPLGNVTQQRYDADGDVTMSIDGRNDSTTFGYDALDRQTSMTDPNVNTTLTQYDGMGNVVATVVATIDPLGHTNRTAYDLLGEVIGTDGDGNITLYGYDPVGNPIYETDPDGNTTKYIYDRDNRQIESIDPLGHASTIGYDAAGNATINTDRDGNVTDDFYDADNRLTGETWYTPSFTLSNSASFTYDNNGDMLAASDDNGTITFGYDAQNRETTTTDVFGPTLNYAYDGNGNTTGETDSLGGSTTSTYNADNELTSRQFTDGTTPLRNDFGYDADGDVTSSTRYSNLAGTTGPTHYRLPELSQTGWSDNGV
jgi:YD repeat-containing protein